MVNNVKEYIMITQDGCDTTAISICATGNDDAIVQAYTYFGYGSLIRPEEFEVLNKNISGNRLYELFGNLVGQKVLYFGEKSKPPFRDIMEHINRE
mgnify:CR=1 FL=1